MFRHPIHLVDYQYNGFDKTNIIIYYSYCSFHLSTATVTVMSFDFDGQFCFIELDCRHVINHTHHQES